MVVIYPDKKYNTTITGEFIVNLYELVRLHELPKYTDEFDVRTAFTVGKMVNEIEYLKFEDAE